ncbi:MAG: sigma-54-dependent Fis family transcriptional regulator [Myxococcales bacterium]|nr:sigma-54-dependent Fis family transcriptional regulator [Myxococcales bacterium]
MSDERIGVLVVDDDPSVLSSWRAILAGESYRLELFGDPLAADGKLESLEVDVAVVDIRMPSLDGMELLSRIKAKRPDVEVIMMTGYGGVQDAVEAIKRGAHDFLSKPFESRAAAELAVRRAFEKARLARRVAELEREVGSASTAAKIIGNSPAIRRVLDCVKLYAPHPGSVLIVGESGTGKDLVARAIHEASPRAEKKLVTLNCSAISESLLDSELFGHRKGAFTGATANKIGLFESADGGTIFLDEIGDMALATQRALLRTLQQGEVRPVGANRPITVDVRVIAATNVDFDQKMANKTFREDLFYRLNVYRIDMPPLRERGSEDIALLSQHFVQKHAAMKSKKVDGIDPRALDALQHAPWRGNVRELENTLDAAVAICSGTLVTLADLPPRIAELARPSSAVHFAVSEAPPPAAPPPPKPEPARAEAVSAKTVSPVPAPPAPELAAPELPAAATALGGLDSEQVDDALLLPFSQAKARFVEGFERHYLASALERHGSIAAAARAAGVDRSNFRRLLKRHGIHRTS